MLVMMKKKKKNNAFLVDDRSWLTSTNNLEGEKSIETLSLLLPYIRDRSERIWTGEIRIRHDVSEIDSDKRFKFRSSIYLVRQELARAFDNWIHDLRALGNEQQCAPNKGYC